MGIQVRTTLTSAMGESVMDTHVGADSWRTDPDTGELHVKAGARRVASYAKGGWNGAWIVENR